MNNIKIMNEEDYLSLSDKEIAQLIEHLEGIQIKRKKQFIDFMNNKDSSCLQKYLNEHDNNVDLEFLDTKMFKNLQSKDSDFLRLMINTPQWKALKERSFTQPWQREFKETMFNHIFDSVFAHVKLIDLFAVEDKELLLEYMLKGKNFDKLTKECADSIFKLKLINFKDEAIKKYFINSPHEFLITKAIEKNKLKLIPRQIELIFENNVLEYTPETLKAIAAHTPTSLPINLTKVILSLQRNIMGYHGYNEQEKHEGAIRLLIEHKNYEYIISNTVLTQTQLKNFLNVFDKNIDKLKNQSYFFIKEILTNQSQLAQYVKEYIFKNKDTQNLVEKVCLYDKLDNNLESKEQLISKKIKI